MESAYIYLICSYLDLDNSHAIAEDINRYTNLNVRIDESSDDSIDHFEKVTKQLIGNCGAVIFFMSPNCESSDDVRRQLEYALILDKLIIPLFDGISNMPQWLSAKFCTSDCIDYSKKDNVVKMYNNLKSWLTVNTPIMKSDTNLINGHEYVDLGLSVLWATHNLGTAFKDLPGDHYAWGEKQIKSLYSLDTYLFYANKREFVSNENNELVKIEERYNKYNDIDKKTILEPSDDVACVIWGNPWRMPTKVEFQDLIDNCSWKWISNLGKYIGVYDKETIVTNGYLVKSKINGNSIFLPITGGSTENRLSEAYIDGTGTNGLYWSSSLGHKKTYWSDPNFLLFSNNNVCIASNYREIGMSIRAVTDK